ncbi:MAG: sensor histidine kinase [Bulleidia sp.]
MKLDLHGIRFRFWLAFFSLAIGVTCLIGILQVGFIGPYYRNSKIHSVQKIAERITWNLTDEQSGGGIDPAMKETIDNDICVVMYNDTGNEVYRSDSLGLGCIFSAPLTKKPEQLQDMRALSASMKESGSDYTLNFVSDVTDEQMIVYGSMIQAPLSNYYMYINSPLDPISSVYEIFMRQYLLYTFLVVIASSVFAFAYSKKITYPIVSMQEEAKKLARADYSAHFDGGTFTETQKLAETLNHADEKLGKIDTLRRDLIANLSHDIRTPLTDIRAYAEMIRDISGDIPEKREKHLNVIIRETEYMSSLINDMSQLTAMRSGNAEVTQEDVDISYRIREIIELNRTLIHNAGIVLIVDIPEMLIVSSDDVKIGQVIQNYLTNAIKHTPNGKRIWITAYENTEKETVRIEVRDEGEGIAEEEIPYIWDRYYKSSRTFRRDMNSTGLGLAIVRSIAETLKAEYGVISKQGEGSTFFFEIPVRQEK